MTVQTILENITAGGIVSIIVIILSLVEITPIKLSPLKWIGKKVNADISSDIKVTNERIDKIDEKLNAHIVESYRTNILDFADKVMRGKLYPHDKWRQMLKMCSAYEKMIIDEGLINGDATESIEYIKEQYHLACANGEFTDFK